MVCVDYCVRRMFEASNLDVLLRWMIELSRILPAVYTAVDDLSSACHVVGAIRLMIVGGEENQRDEGGVGRKSGGSHCSYVVSMVLRICESARARRRGRWANVDGCTSSW